MALCDFHTSCFTIGVQMRQLAIFSDFKGIAFALTIVVGFATGVRAMPALPSRG